jgi:hypothetical protein
VAVLIVLAAALGVAVVVLALALGGARRDRAEAVAALDVARAEVDDLTAREAAATAVATSTQRELAEADARATEARAAGLAHEHRAAAAEVRAAELVDALAHAVEREQQLRAEVIELTAQAALAADALGAARARGGDPELAQQLWALELARIDREWRVDAAQVHAPDPPLLPTDADAFGRAMRMELDRVLEEVGTPVVLTCALSGPPDPPTALVLLRVAQELLGASTRHLDDVTLDVATTAEGTATIALTGRGTDADAETLAHAPSMPEAMAALGGTYEVTHTDGHIRAMATLPTDTRTAVESAPTSDDH